MYWIVYQHVEADPPEIVLKELRGIPESGLCIHNLAYWSAYQHVKVDPSLKIFLESGFENRYPDCIDPFAVPYAKKKC